MPRLMGSWVRYLKGAEQNGIAKWFMQLGGCSLGFELTTEPFKKSGAIRGLDRGFHIVLGGCRACDSRRTQPQVPLFR